MLVNDVMNDMARHFGEDAYLPEFQSQLNRCMMKWEDTNLTDAQNAAW